MKRQLLLVSILAGLAQLAAFVKVWLTARVFGVSSELDGYQLALIAPTLVSGVLAGFLQTGLFPVRARLHQAGTLAQVAAFDRTVWWGYAALGVLFGVVLLGLSGWLSALLVPADQEGAWVAATSVMPLAACLVTISMVTDCTGYILAMRGSFLIAAGAPIANGMVGALVLALYPQWGLSGLMWSTLAGAAVQGVIVMCGLRQAGLRLCGPLSLSDGWAFVEMARLGAWILPGVVLSNLTVSLPQAWAASFGEGAVSAFGYALRLHSSAVQVLVMACSTLVLAKLSALVAAHDEAGVRRLLRQAVLASLVLGGLAVGGVATLGERVLLLVFGGRFDAGAAAQVSGLWLLLSVGLGFNLLGNVFGKLWQAQSRPMLMSVMAAASFAALYLGFRIFSGMLDAKSVPLAMTVSSITVVVLGFYFIKRRNLDGTPRDNKKDVVPV